MHCRRWTSISPALFLMLWALSGLAGPSLAAPEPAPAGGEPDSARQLVVAREALAAGEPQRAIATLEPALADDDLVVADLAWLIMARARLAAGDTSGARAAAERVTEVAPDTVHAADAAWLVAKASAAAGPPAAAAQAWSRFRARHAGDARAVEAEVAEARALEAAGDVAAAARAWRRLAIEKPHAVEDDALDRALALAAAAGLALEPSGAELAARADALRGANRHRRAVAAYERAEAALGDSTRSDLALVRRARSLYRLRENEAARAACLELLERRPATEYATVCLHLRARVAWRQGDDETIDALTREALEHGRHRGSSWRDDLLYVRGGWLMEKERWDEAIDAWDRLLREHPDSSNADDALWKAAWSRWRQGRHEDAEKRFARTAAEADDAALREAARYWRARSLEAAGRTGEAIEVHEAVILDDPFGYHGRLSRARLATIVDAERLERLDHRVEAAGVAFEAPPPPELGGTPHGRRHAVLAALGGFEREAAAELEAHAESVHRDDSLTFALAEARLAAGDALGAYRLVASRFWRPLTSPSRRSDPALWRIVYPRTHADVLEREARRHGVDPAFAAAIARSESWWQPHVRSSADARGLMQLIPPTAERLAADAGWRDFDPESLFEPEVNLALGTRYLGALLERFGGDEAAAAAAYNAGEDAVDRWWSGFAARGVTDPAERVERIPYRETRPYVKKVLGAAAWYRWLDRGGSATDTKDVPPPG